MGSFLSRLRQAQQRNDSWLCVGLDPQPELLPQAVRDEPSPLLAFCRTIVAATADLVCAYKPNLGFWLAQGVEGLVALESLMKDMPPDVPVILDGKFGDIGHTAAAYARFAFDRLGADAVTVNPYLGLDGVRPFLEREERGAFVLARTSNPSAPHLQEWTVDGRRLYEEVARLAVEWDSLLPGCCGLVVGATYPEELARLRASAVRLPFLIPGVGAQGGDLVAAVRDGPTADGVGPLVNLSRTVLYASPGPDFAAAARAVALEMRERIRTLRLAEGGP